MRVIVATYNARGDLWTQFQDWWFKRCRTCHGDKLVANCDDCLPYNEPCPDCNTAKLVLHHYDPPCTARLENDLRLECKFVPNMQSTCFYFYCPRCDIKLKEDMYCSQCHMTYRKVTDV